MERALSYLRASDFLEELQGKVAIVKSDFNLPLSADGALGEGADFRITQAAPFLRRLLGADVLPILATHLGRPKGYDPKLSLDAIAEPLAKAIEAPVEIVRFNPEKNGYDDLTRQRIYDAHKAGRVILLDNIRFHPDEIRNEGGLARLLAEVADVSVQNSFGTAHRREDTSNYIHELMPGFAGDLLVEEIEAHKAIKKPNSPYVVIVGGDKVKDSLDLMRALFRAETTSHWSNLSDPEINLKIGDYLVDYVVVGGHLMHAFVHAQLQMIDEGLLKRISTDLRKEYRGLRDVKLGGYDLSDEEMREEVRLAKGLLRLYNNYQFLRNDGPFEGRRLVVPVDYMVLRHDSRIPSVMLHELQDEDVIVDVGTKTQEAYAKVIASAGTIVWNGPMGTDDDKYVIGSRAIMDAISANQRAVKEMGGGSTNVVVSAYEKDSRRPLNVGFRSTGGGSTLLEVAYDSPTTISLIMSAKRLLLGGYGDPYEPLRKAALEKMIKAA